MANPTLLKACGGSWASPTRGRCVAVRWMTSSSLARIRGRREIWQRSLWFWIIRTGPHPANSIMMMSWKSPARSSVAREAASMSTHGLPGPRMCSCCLPIRQPARDHLVLFHRAELAPSLGPARSTGAPCWRKLPTSAAFMPASMRQNCGFALPKPTLNGLTM